MAPGTKRQKDPVQCAGGCRKTVERSTMSARSGALVCPKCAARIEKGPGDWDPIPNTAPAPATLKVRHG